MKKWLAFIIACVVGMVSFAGVGAAYQNLRAQSGFAITFNGTPTNANSIIYNNTHYVPLRKVFEAMGAAVFYRGRDRQILALSRDGDTFRHIVGSNVITVGETKKVFTNSSVMENSETYIPVEMLSIFYLDKISYENRQVNIKKQLGQNAYHKVVQDVLNVSKNNNFNPENFSRYAKFHSKSPSYTMEEVLFRVNLGLDYPFYENVTTIEHPYELRILVNKYNRLPTGFNQYNLVSMSREYAANDGREYLMAGVAYEAYKQMANAAKKDGLSLKVVSAYRTEEYQKNLYNNKVKATGKTNADNYSARPGHSEHQTGLAVDINSTNNNFDATAEFRWLQKNAYKYGFILRYPKGKTWITGYAYEPWHYRYVGVDAAKIIQTEGITFEEYHAKYVVVNEFK